MVQSESGISTLSHRTSSQRTEFVTSLAGHARPEGFVSRMSVGNEIVCRTVAASVSTVAGQRSPKESRIGATDVFRGENIERSAVRQNHPVLESDGVAVLRGIAAIDPE